MMIRVFSSKVDAPDVSGLLFYQGRMRDLINRLERGGRNTQSFVFLFCHDLSSVVYTDRVTNAIEAGCQPTRVKSQRVESNLR